MVLTNAPAPFGDRSAAASLIVEEALSSVLAPRRLAEVLDESLSMAELPGIPDEPESLSRFVEGALFATLARHLEVGDALELVHQIRATLALALHAAPSPGERPISMVQRRTGLPAGPRRVLVVSRASLVVFLLQDALGDDVDVLPVSDAGELDACLERSRAESLLVVVDRRHPCVDLDVCGRLATLGSDSTVVWWGACGAERREVGQRLRGGPRLVPCEFDMQLADLSDVCRTFVGTKG